MYCPVQGSVPVDSINSVRKCHLFFQATSQMSPLYPSVYPMNSTESHPSPRPNSVRLPLEARGHCCSPHPWQAPSVLPDAPDAKGMLATLRLPTPGRSSCIDFRHESQSADGSVSATGVNRPCRLRNGGRPVRPHTRRKRSWSVPPARGRHAAGRFPSFHTAAHLARRRPSCRPPERRPP